ncbi:MAG: MBOAT family protein [Rhodospirillales bacterium]
MLFSSSIFLIYFLPITVFIAALLARFAGKQSAFIGIIIASFVFYGWWNPVYVILLATSIIINFALGVSLIQRPNKTLLISAIAFNLGLLAYYKYAGFLLEAINDVTGLRFGVDTSAIILPLAISFFTFQQIAFQVDAFQGKVKNVNLLEYTFFVSFFPQLIAGPIVHHQEIMPQYRHRDSFLMRGADLYVGLIIFAIGLFKKVVIADGLDPYADTLFDSAQQNPTLIDAWAGMLAYTFQIYFDFSGYSDMAIGLARIFGIKLPLNFFSPYKAVNIIDFWRRWHITLSRFLRDYLYIPLGGNRKGIVCRYLNLFITMLNGGLWHGAAWTFVFWGGLHGFFLAVNHGWHALKRHIGYDRRPSSPAGRMVSRLITFVAVVTAWAFFRANTFEDAFAILAGMAGLNGIVLSSTISEMLGGISLGLPLGQTLFGYSELFVWLAVLLMIVWCAPNTQELTAAWKPVLMPRYDAIAERLQDAEQGRNVLVRLQQNLNWLMPFSLSTAAVCILIAIYRGDKMQEFIYFAF